MSRARPRSGRFRGAPTTPTHTTSSGLLLETGSSSNAGNWSNADYDALIDEAAATADPAEQARLYAQAQDILEVEAPIVPVEYNESWALSRLGLLGALDSGVGFIRYAGLDVGAGDRPMTLIRRLAPVLLLGGVLAAAVGAAMPAVVLGADPTYGQPSCRPPRSASR